MERNFRALRLAELAAGAEIACATTMFDERGSIILSRRGMLNGDVRIEFQPRLRRHRQTIGGSIYDIRARGTHEREPELLY